MNYKNTKELKDIFGIDITEKNRTIQYVAMRSFYAESKINELKGNITSRYTKVANEIGCNRDNLYNMLLKAKLFKEDIDTKMLFTAFQNKDKEQIEAYHQNLRDRKARQQSDYYQNKSLNEFIPAQRVKVLTKQDKNKSLMSNLKLAEYLRTNKVFKSELWDVPVKNISPNQWEKVKKINPKMFEEIVNA
jgi:hypothetical protein